MNADDTTAERSGSASTAAGGERTASAPRLSPDLSAGAAAPWLNEAAAGGGRPAGDWVSVAAVEEPAQPGGWPNIADYWPDAPQRMGPPADMHEEPGAAPTRIDASWQEPAVRAAMLGRPAPAAERRGRGRVLGGAVLAVLLLLGGGLVAYRKMAQENRPAGGGPAALPSATATAAPPPRDMGPATVLPAPSPSAAGTAATAGAPGTGTPAARPDKGTFTLVDDVTAITIRTTRLDDGIVKVVVPDGSDAVPRTTVDKGTVTLGLARGGHRTDLVVQLDNRVSWAIRIGGGARQMTVDLGGADVRSVTFDGGAARIDLSLPRLDGTLPIEMRGGVNQWRIATAGRVKVQLVARQGAGRVVLYGREQGGLNRGQRVTADGVAGIDVDAAAGFGSLTVVGA